MKRIVYILDTLSMPGGIARVISGKASWLAEHGYDVTILQTEGSGTDSYFPLSPRVRVVALDINFLVVYDNGRGVAGMLRSAWDRVRKEWLFARRCAEFLRKEKYDVIFTAGNHVGLTRIGDGSRKVFETHFSQQTMREFQRELSPLPRLLYRLHDAMQRRQLRRYDAVVLLTERDRQLRGCPPNARVIPNFITVDEPADWPDYSARRVISVGRLSEAKNYYNLFEAWALVKAEHPDWRLDIYGHGYGREEAHRDVMRRCGVDDVVTLHAPVKDIQRQYLASAFYVMSSAYEGFGLVLTEAMTCGLPCVAYDCNCGPAEIIRQGVDGLVVRPVSDARRLADAICWMIEHPTQREAMGHAAREDVRRFAIDYVMARWVQLIEEK